jgi:hypothetical protein
MAPSELIKQLTAAGCRLQADGDQLRVLGLERDLTDDLQAAIREHKEAILALLELYEERAAIMEYDGGLPRADAERQAWAIVLGGATVQQVERQEVDRGKS